jgi:hypothetical protein
VLVRTLRKCHMSRLQLILMTAAIAGFAAYTWALYPTESWSVSNLIRIVALFGSIVLIAGFIALGVLGVIRTKAAPSGKGLGAIVFALVAFCVACLVAMVVVDQGPGTWIRSMPGFWSHLPRGNLFITGGRDGWTYVVIALVLGLAVFGEKLTAPLLVYLGFRLAPTKETPRRSSTTEDGPPEKGPWSLADMNSKR